MIAWQPRSAGLLFVVTTLGNECICTKQKPTELIRNFCWRMKLRKHCFVWFSLRPRRSVLWRLTPFSISSHLSILVPTYNHNTWHNSWVLSPWQLNSFRSSRKLTNHLRDLRFKKYFSCLISKTGEELADCSQESKWSYKDPGLVWDNLRCLGINLKTHQLHHICGLLSESMQEYKRDFKYGAFERALVNHPGILE